MLKQFFFSFDVWEKVKARYVAIVGWGFPVIVMFVWVVSKELPRVTPGCSKISSNEPMRLWRITTMVLVHMLLAVFLQIVFRLLYLRLTRVPGVSDKSVSTFFDICIIPPKKMTI